MNYYQLRGVTGISPKKNYNAENYAKAALLPTQKADEFSRNATQQSLKMQADRAEMMKDAMEADRKRGMYMQGGMLGLKAADAFDINPETIGKAVTSGVTGLLGKGAETVTTGGDSLSGFGGMSANAQMPGYGLIAGANEFAGDIARGAKDYFVDPIVENVSKGLKYAGDVIDEGVDYIGGLFA